jgi:mRNA-degrading endonuclease toxin of MazEF toxin-antitoxin module
MPKGIIQGSIWQVDLGEGDARPCIVVSREALNRGQLVLVVPCTTSNVQEKVRFPNHVRLVAGAAGLPRESAAMTHLVQPVETTSLGQRFGQLSDEDLTRVLHGLAWTVDLFEHI